MSVYGRNSLIIFFLIIKVKCTPKLPDADMPIMDLISHYGYPVEEHQITTEDGVILTTFRIPYGKNMNSTNGNPILLSHGMGGCSENFITAGPNDAIAYNLADAGYDVWLCNTRGNFHSRKHLTLDPNTDSKFWDFSFHEVGIYDMTANIDYILNVTNDTGVIFLGHSQGGSNYFVLLSERPEYESKIKLSVQFAPSVLFGFIKAPLIDILVNFYPLVIRIIGMLNLHEVYPNNDKMTVAVKEMCNGENWVRHICTYVLHFIGGADIQPVNETVVQYITANSPAGTSAKSSIHYLQGIKYKSFRKFDYGYTKNLELYQRNPPPLYNLMNNAPIAFFYGDMDWLVPPEGVKALIRILPNVVLDYEVKGYNHVDFIFAQNAKQKINIPLIKFMDNYFGIAN